MKNEGLLIALKIVEDEPNFDGPMPWRNWFCAIFCPERSVRAAGEAWRKNIARKIRAEIEKK